MVEIDRKQLDNAKRDREAARLNAELSRRRLLQALDVPIDEGITVIGTILSGQK
jgi:hypothetical protein